MKEIKGNDKKNYTVLAAINELEKIVAVQNGNGIANVKQNFTSLGNDFFTLYGKQNFTSSGKEFFT